MNGVPNDSDNSFDEIDFLRYTVVNCRPDTDKKVLDARPDVHPEFFYFTKISAENTADHIQRIFQRIFDEIPYCSKDALNAVPHSAPVAGKDADENIQNTQDDVCHSLEDICNLLELPLKDRFQELAESVPYSLDDLGDIFEVKPQRINAVNNALTEAAEDRFYLLPDSQ